MADLRFTGNAVAVAQVDTFTPANPNTGDIYYLTVTGLDGTTFEVSFTVAGTETVAAVTAGLTAAWNAATDALCTGITAADGTTVLTLTADTAGTAFSVAASIFDGEGGAAPTLGRAATTKNEGPSDWSSADNWSGGAVPGAAGSQDVTVEGATILYGLDQSGIANALDSLNITESQIGSNPASGYVPFYLQIKATTLNIGYHYGPSTAVQSAPINVDLGATASTVVVDDTGSNTTQPAVRLLANNAATNIRVRKGTVGIAHEAGETATVGIITVAYVSSVSSDADVFIGSGVTLTTLNQTGGDIELRCGLTTATIKAGTLDTAGSGTITTLNAAGGAITSNSTGTITTLNITAGTVDFTKSAAARTVTTLKLDNNGILKYDPAILTRTNKLDSDNAVTLTASAA